MSNNTDNTKESGKNESTEKPVFRVVGRPRIFSSQEDLINCINDYFKNTQLSEWRITGLALHLRIARSTLYEWIAEKREFSDIIKEACMAIEDKYANNCEKRGNAGDIFILKNMGWTDRQDINMNHSGSIGLGDVLLGKK